MNSLKLVKPSLSITAIFLLMAIETFSDIIPKFDERTVTIGLAGSGKTFLMQSILANRKRLVIIDPKREFEYKGALVVSDPKKILHHDKVTIYRPKENDIDNLIQYDLIFKRIYYEGNITCYIDELAAFSNANRYPRWLKVCYHMGRSKNVSMMATTQRPSDIPSCAISESNRFYVFMLSLPSDVRKVQGFVPGYAPKEMSEPYTFYYYNNRNPSSHAQTLRLKK